MRAGKAPDGDTRRVRALLRRSMVTSLMGSLGIVGAMGCGAMMAMEREAGPLGAATWPVLMVLCLAASAAAGFLAHRDNREAVEFALRRGRPGMLGATGPEPFLSRDAG